MGLSAARPAADRPGPDFDVRDYRLVLTPSLDDGSVKGREQITLVSLRDGLQEVSFSGNALTVVSDGGAAAGVERRGDLWIVRLKRPLARGARAVVALRFSGKPARGLVVGPTSIHTDYFACDWMICNQGRPGDKATFDLNLFLPPTYRPAAASGQMGRVMYNRGDALVRHHVRLARPYSSYLYGFAAGRLTGAVFLDGPDGIRAFSDVVGPDQLRATLGETGDMRRFYQEKAGVPYPASSYTELVVAGDAAQESAGYSTLGWDTLSAVLKDPQEDWLAAHELAHQWWGNLVTCASWDDFWLNEGIASFMVAAWKEHRWGRPAYDREMALFRARVGKARAAGVDVPLTFHGPYPSLSLKRAITYSKGALFMDALRREMGEAAFWAGVKRYTRAHAGGAADSHDFQKAMQAESDKPLGPLFDAWVY
jgi:aminopeptidase N